MWFSWRKKRTWADWHVIITSSYRQTNDKEKVKTPTSLFTSVLQVYRSSPSLITYFIFLFFCSVELLQMERGYHGKVFSFSFNRSSQANIIVLGRDSLGWRWLEISEVAELFSFVVMGQMFLLELNKIKKEFLETPAGRRRPVAGGWIWHSTICNVYGYVLSFKK